MATKDYYADLMKRATSQAEREQIARQAADAALSGSRYGDVQGLRDATPAYATNNRAKATATAVQSAAAQPPAYYDPTADINDYYDQMRQSQLAQLRAAQERGASVLNDQRADIAPAYRTARNQADTQAVISADRLREAMARNGLLASGTNRSQQTALEVARQNAMSSLDVEEQRNLRDIDTQLANLYNPNEEIAMDAALNAERSRMLMDALTNASTQNYQRYRDILGDTRYTDETAYARERDALLDQRYASETDWARSADNPAVRAQQLANEIAQMQLQNLPEQQRLELEQLRKQIAQIGAAPYRSQQQIDMDQVELDTARERLNQLKNPSQAQNYERALELAQQQMEILYPQDDVTGKNPLSVPIYTEELNRWYQYYLNNLGGGGGSAQSGSVAAMIAQARANGYTDAEIRTQLIQEGYDPADYGL
jgi:hypothetical protein